MEPALTEIALGIVIEHDLALIIERQQREIGKSGTPIIWAFPGGKLDAGETPEQAAVREVLEETGHKVKAETEIITAEHPEYPVLIHYIGCSLIEKATVRTPQEIVAVKWEPVQNLPNVFTWPINNRVLGYLGLEEK